MQFQTSLYVLTAALAAFAAASPAPNPNAAPAPAPFAAAEAEVRSFFEKRASCSGNREEDEICGGKKLQKQNSFHNCKNSGGKCCANESDGSGGIDVSKGLGREDCGYCFSGKCKA